MSLVGIKAFNQLVENKSFFDQQVKKQTRRVWQKSFKIFEDKKTPSISQQINVTCKLEEDDRATMFFYRWKAKNYFNLIQDGLFRGCSRMGLYPTIMKRDTVIPYLRKTQKMYKSRDTSLEFCWHQHFSPEISKFCYIKKYRYRLDFDT